MSGYSHERKTQEGTRSCLIKENNKKKKHDELIEG